MSTHHPTTAALLARVRKDAVRRADYPEIGAWLDAGCPDAPVQRFVPTEPNYYYRKTADTWTIVDVCGPPPLVWVGCGERDPRPVTDDGLWLGPVAPWAPPSAHPDPGPCPPKPRTAEEARANPMPGDRWRAAATGEHYTVTDPRSDKARYVWRDGTPGRGRIAGLGETYLGHFPLETP